MKKLYTITTTYTSDDYKRPDTSTETFTTTSKQDAMILATKQYLERVYETETLEYKGKGTFQSIVESNSDYTKLTTSLYDYFQNNESTLFEGEFVPNTFSVNVESAEIETPTETSVMDLIGKIKD